MSDIHRSLEEGLAALEARDYGRAASCWRAVLAIDPDHVRARQLLAELESLGALPDDEADPGELARLQAEVDDLREELELTRESRNDLLVEVARLHRRYQQREAKLLRMRDAREQALRDRAERLPASPSPATAADVPAPTAAGDAATVAALATERERAARAELLLASERERAAKLQGALEAARQTPATTTSDEPELRELLAHERLQNQELAAALVRARLMRPTAPLDAESSATGPAATGQAMAGQAMAGQAASVSATGTADAASLAMTQRETIARLQDDLARARIGERLVLGERDVALAELRDLLEEAAVEGLVSPPTRGPDVRPDDPFSAVTSPTPHGDPLGGDDHSVAPVELDPGFDTSPTPRTGEPSEPASIPQGALDPGFDAAPRPTTGSTAVHQPEPATVELDPGFETTPSTSRLPSTSLESDPEFLAEVDAGLADVFAGSSQQAERAEAERAEAERAEAERAEAERAEAERAEAERAEAERAEAERAEAERAAEAAAAAAPANGESEKREDSGPRTVSFSFSAEDFSDEPEAGEPVDLGELSEPVLTSEPPAETTGGSSERGHTGTSTPAIAATNGEPTREQPPVPDESFELSQGMEWYAEQRAARAADSALESLLEDTPEPPRLITGMMPALPDLDLLDDVVVDLPADKLEDNVDMVPVRNAERLDAAVSPVASYLLTHIDGASSFRELVALVGLPQRAVYDGFRELLRERVIQARRI